MLAIMAGTAAGQVLAVAVSPIISRLYTPADFGVFSVVSGLAITIGTATALRYELAVPLPHDDDDARSLVALGAFWCLITGSLLTVAFWLLTPWIAGFFDESGLAQLLIFVPAIAAMFGLFRLLNQWALRQLRYGATAVRNVVSSVATVITQLIGGWSGLGPAGLVAGLGAGQGVGAASLLKGSHLFSGEVSKVSMLRNQRRYKRFPLLLAPAGLINASGVYVPLLMIAALYGTEAAGWLGFTQRILAVPMTLIGQSVAQVYLSQLALTRRESTGAEVKLFWSATKRLGMLGFAGAALLMVVAPALFATVFGEQWRPAGSMARALAISLAFQMVASSLSQTLIVFERTGLQLAWDIGRLIATAGTVVVCSQLNVGLLPCIWAYSIVSACAYVVSWDMGRRTIVRSSRVIQTRDN